MNQHLRSVMPASHLFMQTEESKSASMIARRNVLRGSGAGASTNRQTEVVMGTPEGHVRMGRPVDRTSIIDSDEGRHNVAEQLWRNGARRRNMQQTRYSLDPVYLREYLNLMRRIQEQPQSYNQIRADVENTLQDILNRVGP